jgi:hypothetical protein
LGGGARGNGQSGAAQKQNSEYSWSMERRRMVKEREGEREREDERIENKKSIVESNRIHLKLVTTNWVYW